ncbi:MAG: TIGR04222 domain-containing membrane protein [Luteolibacter sp.]
MIHLVLAVSVFDWKGPDFLVFYAVGFLVALAWSVIRRFRGNDKFALEGALEPQLTDPYEVAFLAGGAPRCSQLAVVKLIKTGAVEWKKAKLFKTSRLIATGSAQADFTDAERALFTSVLGYGKKGMSLSEVSRLVATRLTGIEAKLAKLGLRPTAGDKAGTGFSTSLPLFALMAIGIVKVVVGLSRDKPVVFLIVFLVVTLFAALIVAANTKKLTPKGEKLLDNMRDGYQADTMLSSGVMGIALMGVAGAGDPSLLGLDSALAKDISQIGDVSVGAGSGCSSGCSSGCGGCGGGCGGCGG